MNLKVWNMLLLTSFVKSMKTYLKARSVWTSKFPLPFENCWAPLMISFFTHVFVKTICFLLTPAPATMMSISGNNSPASRELFKPFTDLGSLLIPIKNILSFGFGVFWGWRYKWGSSCVFWPRSPGPGPQPNEPFLAQMFFGYQAIIRAFRALDWLSSISGATALV